MHVWGVVLTVQVCVCVCPVVYICRIRFIQYTGCTEIGAGYRTSVNSSLQFTSSTQEKENYEIVELAQCWIAGVGKTYVDYRFEDKLLKCL